MQYLMNEKSWLLLSLNYLILSVWIIPKAIALSGFYIVPQKAMLNGITLGQTISDSMKQMIPINRLFV